MNFNRKSSHYSLEKRMILGRPPGEDPYEALGVTTEATSAEIRKAYRKLSMLWHPDKNQGDKQAEATEKFSSIGTAYEKIGACDIHAGG